MLCDGIENFYNPMLHLMNQFISMKIVLTLPANLAKLLGLKFPGIVMVSSNGCSPGSPGHPGI